jgi:hypothetical protein
MSLLKNLNGNCTNDLFLFSPFIYFDINKDNSNGKFRMVSGSQDLNRPAPPAYAKFSSLDRRALARRHHSTNNSHLQQQQQQQHPNSNNPVHIHHQQHVNNTNALQQQHQQSSATAKNSNSNPLKLSTFNPTEAPVGVSAQSTTPQKPAGSKCQPERRHSSYNPASSLTRTPSQNSEYRYNTL